MSHSDQVDRPGQEEFIWAMRSRTLDNDEEDKWRERRLNLRRISSRPLTESEERLHREEVVVDTCTKLVSTFLPDEIITDPSNYNIRIYDAAIARGTITGMDTMWEKYRMFGKGGPSHMSQMLNSYIGGIMQEAFAYDGDVIMCSSSVFTIMWKQTGKSMSDCVHQAVDCSLSIVKSFISAISETIPKISVCIVICSGPVFFSLIGTPKCSTFVLTGDPIEDSKELSVNLSGNQVLVEQAAWDYLNSAEYIATITGEEYDCYLISDFSTAWRSIQRYTEKTRVKKSTSDADMSQMSLRQIANREMQEVYELRPTIADAVTMKILGKLRRFIFPPLMNRLDMAEPIDVLVRMRYSVVMYTKFEFEAQTYTEMIKLTDTFYKMINNIIERYNGYINGISYTDNELNLTVLFGIHGDTQEVDCGNALKAAMKCFKGSENTANLHALSMAVVSGWLFSGPVGHNMRREFCTVGANIERARKQANEYANKVTCDKETFLRSKLESRNFILQDKSEELSIYADLGLSYEYVEFDASNRLPKLILNKYPVLDRNYELETFKKMLGTITPTLRSSEIHRYRTKYEASALFFLNEPCSGNTRLIEELVYLTPTEYPSFRLRLTDPDKFIPYQAVYLIFGVPLGIAENSTISDREAKLLSKLKSLPLDGLESVLNIIFRVNFPKSPVVENLKQDEMVIILKDLIKCLCRLCFNRPWVIFVDNAENIDCESWELLYSIIETHLVLLVLAIGCQRNQLPPIARNVICRTKSKCVHLQPIDKLFHATLACQLMEVLAIPVQLEKLLQDHSGGNPGWVQKVLLTLIDQEVIVIRKVTNITDFKLQVIMPIKGLMSRDASKMKQSVALKGSQTLLQPAIALNRQQWEIFQTVVKIEEAFEHMDVEDYYIKNKISGSIETTSASMGSVITGPRHKRVSSNQTLSHKSEVSSYRERSFDENLGVVDICIMAPNGEEKLNSYQFLNPHDFSMSRILDLLSSFEMHFLKCGAVIGDCFLRDTLMFVMECEDECEITRACERLFELRIIACAEGDFRKPLMNYAPTYTDRFKIYDDILIQCNCVGCLIPESCAQATKYSNCGYMRFVCSQLRILVYNLLTPVQLYDLHTKAINFLEKSTRKCVSCGNGIFTKILGNNYEEGVLTERKGEKAPTSKLHDTKNSTNILENWDVILHTTNSASVKRYDKTKVKGKREESGFIFVAFAKSTITGPKARVPMKFEDSDFTCCECDQILKCLYFNLRHHYQVTERYDKWLYATLEYSELCIADANVPLALKMLNNALDIIKGPYRAISNPGEAWKYNVMIARVMTEIGRARSMIGQTRFAYQAYETALGHYGYSLPKPASFRYRMMEFIEYLKIITGSRRGIGTKFGYAAEFADNVSNCLCKMTKLFIKLDMWDNAYIAALWSVKKALLSEKSFMVLLNAFTTLIYVSARMRKYAIVDHLEIVALDYCRRYNSKVDVNDLRSVAKLYAAIFYIRVQRARFDDAFLIGVSLDTITDMLQLRYQLIKLFPLFFELLLLQSDLNDLINAFATFEQVSGITGDYVGDVWFHSLAIYFHLQTGCMLVDIHLSESYYYTQCKRLINLSEPEAEKRYFVAIWLWYLRTENYDVADIWHKKLPDEWKVDPYESINNLITTLMYVEGLIIILTQKMDRRILIAVEDMFTLIGDLIQELELHAVKVRLIGPRLYHLKAYFCMCKQEEYRGWDSLDKAMKLAQSSGNMFDAQWAEHSGRAWKHDMPTLERTWWKDHADHALMEYREMESSHYKIMYYTLELPLYV